ncbi:MAG: DUF5675 family protein [Gallionella sp.]
MTALMVGTGQSIGHDMRDDAQLAALTSHAMAQWEATHGGIMHIQIVRGLSAPHGTVGKLDTGMGFTCDTLELQWADNRRGVSCIKPAPGEAPETYSAVIWYSPTFKRDVVRLEDKFGRHDVLLHNGNFASSIPGEISQIHGCTEVGRGYGQIRMPRNHEVTQFGILHSVATLEALIEHIRECVGNNEFTVTYSWGAE